MSQSSQRPVDLAFAHATLCSLIIDGISDVKPRIILPFDPESSKRSIFIHNAGEALIKISQRGFNG